jgi:hypothetical protein
MLATGHRGTRARSGARRPAQLRGFRCRRPRCRPLHVGATYLADQVHANHPRVSFPASKGQRKDADTSRQRSRNWTRKSPLRGSLLRAISQFGEPIRVGLCHCLTCRKAHAAAFFPFVIFRKDQVRILGATSADKVHLENNAFSVRSAAREFPTLRTAVSNCRWAVSMNLVNSLRNTRRGRSGGSHG